jgi:peptide/nickel transport system permease protein
VIANLLILAAQFRSGRADLRVHRADSPDADRRLGPVRRPAAASVLPTSRWRSAIAGYSRYQRNAMLDVLGQDFIRTAGQGPHLARPVKHACAPR